MQRSELKQKDELIEMQRSEFKQKDELIDVIKNELKQKNEIIEKSQYELMQMSDWASRIKAELDDIDKSLILGSLRKVRYYNTRILNIWRSEGINVLLKKVKGKVVLKVQKKMKRGN
jgi:hypothetical protein